MNTKLLIQATKHFSELINNNGKTLTAMLKLLKQEKVALEQRDFKTHKKVLAQKQVEIPKLSKIDKEFEVLFCQLGLEFSTASVDNFLTQIPPSVRQELQTKWQKMIKLLKECQEMNAVNERIVFHTKQSADRLMSLIKGESIHSKTYSASGKANMYSNAEQCLATA